MISIRAKHKKTLWAIIQRVRFVVDDFPLGQIAAEHCLDHQAVFQYIALLRRIWVVWAIQVSVAFHDLLAPFPAWVAVA
jgi:hypothetical protein